MSERRIRDLTPESPSAPLRSIIRIDSLKEGEERLIEVGEAERAEIAQLLELVALDRLDFACGFERRGQGRLFLRGSLSAAVTQTCVVSLEPVASALQVPVEVEFWPASSTEELVESTDETAHYGMLDWPEPIREGKIDLGPVIYETLATALDPYPRREGASVAWTGVGTESSAGDKAESPFAALERLKRR
jgi:uncharacterized metal-binding protein YceD (DUF177 family)